jgi:hypothetical protein
MPSSDIIINAKVFDPDHIDPSTAALNAYIIANAGQGVKWHDADVILSQGKKYP